MILRSGSPLDASHPLVHLLKRQALFCKQGRVDLRVGMKKRRRHRIGKLRPQIIIRLSIHIDYLA